MADFQTNGSLKNILVCDHSALHYHLHCDKQEVGGRELRTLDLGESYAGNANELSAFNTEHPLFGGEPVSILVGEQRLRIHTCHIEGRLITSQVPAQSAVELRQGLYVACPEFTLIRLAPHLSDTQIAEVGMNLSGRYYINPFSGAIEERSGFITSPDLIREFCHRAQVRGSRKTEKAVRWMLPNSGSPMETKMKLQFCHPLWHGGFASPFTKMNYNISSNRLRSIMEQGTYCLDLACPELKIALEYDGEEYHRSKSKDHQRRNAIRALGWQVFPIDKGILYNAEATERMGYQISKCLGKRLQKPKHWEEKFIELRKDLNLPV